ncbi:family 78 glycoside hydrolase catalytic domain [Aerococcaceae bacterium zg-ZUI334]|uniref:family 78 glycoside hydrolase catalytic domain n=1 Tax=Aerococcaceae bacterium zg-252 TaxID=2796928 RepID=UPI001B905B8D|nr:family 78 glycoside hydrolase catalytic domain [Aerococcaceae bacterium zg-ZUI334]
MKIHNLKVNGVKEPLGYQYDYLTFSWEFSAEESIDDLEFTIEVSKSSQFEEIVWAEKTDNPFNTLTTSRDFLEPYTCYYWRVSAGNCSQISRFETAKEDESWLGEWISYEEETLPSVNFSKTIQLSKPAQKARLYALGLGLYEIELNGQKVGREYLNPGYHSYDLINQYQTYDITNDLKSDNQLTFIVGNGWYRGRFIFEGGFENIYGDKQKLIAELHVTYTDNSQEVFITDDSWTVTSSIIQDNSIYDGEVIDFSAKEKSLTPMILQDTKNLLTARMDLPVSVMETLTPKIFRDAANNLILDFGQEITGWITGLLPAGKERVTFQFGEILQDGQFYTENLRTAKQTFTLLHNDQDRVIRPHFTFFGFRYVKVEGLTEEEAAHFNAQVLHSEMDETFRFNSSHTKLNQLLSNIRWSQKDNFLSIPTDCPQRDERMGWTGDITVFANTASYNMETRAFLGHFMTNLRLEQKELGGAVPFFAPYPKIAPREGLNPFLTSAGAAVWGDASTVLPLTLYKHFRDKGLLSHHIDAMTDWVDYIYQQDEARGGRRLWDFGWQLGDWLALDSGIKGSVFGATDSALVASVYYYISADYTAKALEILSDSRVNRYQQLAEEIRKAIIETYFVDNKLNLKPVTLQSEVEQIRQGMAKHFGGQEIPTCVDSQTGLSLLLQYKLYPNEAARDDLTQRLANNMVEHDGFLTTGFAGTPALPHALLENGLEKEAFELLFKELAPSWLFEVNMGATTTWERWDSLLPDGKISGIDMNSMNHYAYGAVEDFIIEKLLGINLPEVHDDSAMYMIKPHYTNHLDWVEGSLVTANGEISVRWEKINDAYQTTVTVPVRTNAKFVLKTGDVIELLPGKNII